MQECLSLSAAAALPASLITPPFKPGDEPPGAAASAPLAASPSRRLGVGARLAMRRFPPATRRRWAGIYDRDSFFPTRFSVGSSGFAASTDGFTFHALGVVSRMDTAQRSGKSRESPARDGRQ